MDSSGFFLFCFRQENLLYDQLQKKTACTGNWVNKSGTDNFISDYCKNQERCSKKEREIVIEKSSSV